MGRRLHFVHMAKNYRLNRLHLLFDNAQHKTLCKFNSSWANDQTEKPQKKTTFCYLFHFCFVLHLHLLCQIEAYTSKLWLAPKRSYVLHQRGACLLGYRSHWRRRKLKNCLHGISLMGRFLTNLNRQCKGPYSFCDLDLIFNVMTKFNHVCALALTAY